MNTLGTIVSFEIRRTLRRPSFWLMTLLFPALMIVIGFIAYTSASSADVDQSSQTDFSFEYTDPAGLIDPTFATAVKGTLITDEAAGVEGVRAGRSQAFFAYPANPTAQPTRVYGQDVGLFDSGKYSAVAQALLTASAQQRIGDPLAVGIVTGQVTVETTTYSEGQPAGGLGAIVAPALLVVLFFLLVLLLSNQMLSAFIEEKENRVAEISLTSMSASTMLAGKVISLLVLGVVQMVVVAIVPVTWMLTGGSAQLMALGAMIGTITVDPVTMTIGVLILLGGFGVNMTSTVTVGVLVPSVKDANSMFTPIILFTVLPLYLVPMMVSNPEAVMVQVATFIPWSAGITALARNAIGNLPAWQATVVIVEQFVVTAVILWFANKVSRFGLISYDKTLDVRALLRRKART